MNCKPRGSSPNPLPLDQSWQWEEQKYSNVKHQVSREVYKMIYFSIVSILLGFPQPQYRWLKDGDFISEFSSEHFYKIQSVSQDDAGSYQCIARNSVGSIISEMIPLTVACKYFINNLIISKVKLLSCSMGKLGHDAFRSKVDICRSKVVKHACLRLGIL